MAEAYAPVYLGAVSAMAGDVGAAVRQMRQGWDAADRHGWTRLSALASALIGEVQVLHGLEHGVSDMQQVLHYSALKGGVVYLPFGIAIGAGIGIGTGLMPKVGVKALLTTGMVLGAVGMVLTSGIGVGASYWSDIFPGMVVLGFGSGLSFPAFGNASLHQVTAQDSGLASGVQNAMQQIAGAIGLAVLVTLAYRHAQGLLSDGVEPAVAIVKGYVLSYRVAAALLAAGAVAVLLLLEHVDPVPRQAEAELEVLAD